MKIWLFYVLAFLSINHSKILEAEFTIDKKCSDGSCTYAICKAKADLENKNYIVECEGAIVSELLLRDSNGLIVGSSGYIGSHFGRGIIKSINGKPINISITAKGNEDYSSYKYSCDADNLYLLDKVSATCKRVAFCKSYEYQETLFKCSMIPKNAKKIDLYTWLCNDGYEQNENTCEFIHKSTLPLNAMWLTDTSNTWRCNSGFTKIGNTCTWVHKLKLKSNAYWINDFSDLMNCKQGYYNHNDNCVKRTKSKKYRLVKKKKIK